MAAVAILVHKVLIALWSGLGLGLRMASSRAACWLLLPVQVIASNDSLQNDPCQAGCWTSPTHSLTHWFIGMLQSRWIFAFVECEC